MTRFVAEKVIPTVSITEVDVSWQERMQEKVRELRVRVLDPRESDQARREALTRLVRLETILQQD